MTIKVLFLHHGGSIGGAPVSMLQLAAALDRTRFEPLAVFSRGGPIVNYARELAVPATVVPLNSAFYYSAHASFRIRMLGSFLWHYQRTVRAAYELARHASPQIVHLNTSVLVPAAVGFRRAGVPIVWHIREAAGANPVLRRWMVERIRHLADHIITNSEYVARAYRGTKPVTVVHNALNGSWFSPYPEEKRRQMRLDLGLPIDAPVVGIVGAAHSLKGHFLLIQAARTVVAEMPRARFLVVAGGVSSEYRRTVRGTIKSLLGLPMDHLERMQRMVRHHGLVENFVYCGFRSDIPAVVSAMDVLVFPSLVPEGFGRPIIEGMAMGCPVIASDIGPSREIAADAAVYVPPGNADRLATGILAVLRDPQKASRLGRTGRQRFLDHFEMKAAVARLEAVYDQVLCAR